MAADSETRVCRRPFRRQSHVHASGIRRYFSHAASLGIEFDAAIDGSTLGVKSILFRPPYGIDHQPEYAEEVAQLPQAQEMGYLIVGQKN